jgi:hypothetical protein
VIQARSFPYSRQGLHGQIAANAEQQSSESQPFRVIKLQHPAGHFAHLRKWLNVTRIQVEVLFPPVGPRVEETNEFASPKTNGAKVSAFVPVAMKARVSQVFRYGETAVFDADDMGHFTTVIDIQFVNQTVLANAISPLRY